LGAMRSVTGETAVLAASVPRARAASAIHRGTADLIMKKESSRGRKVEGLPGKR
jgi:hypothetical protein